MKRRGRPPNTRPRIDLGTPELIAKRVAAAPRDPTLATTPLDVCKARGIISDEAHAAARCFAALRKIVFGKAHPGAIDLTAVSGRPDEFDAADAEKKYREACLVLRHYSRNCLDAVENVVVHERWPEWIYDQSYRSGRKYELFCLGIAALLGWYKGGIRRAA